MSRPAPPPELTSDAHLAEGVAALSAQAPELARAAEVAGPVRLRRRPQGFEALLFTILSQQVSVASAEAVRARVEAAGLADRATLAAASQDDLRACGLSRQKIRYALALAQSDLDFDALGRLADEDAIARLVALPGIGRWTAEIYVMFAMGRPDVFAAGDLALQEAVRLAQGLEARPTERQLREIAADWAPWRTVAATLLWQYYGAVKGREGVTT